MQCPHCGQEHPDTTSFCPITGQRLAGSNHCTNCGFKLQENWKACPKCGKSVDLAGNNNVTKNKTTGRKAFLWAFVSFFVVALAIASYSRFSGQSKSDVKNNSDTTPTEVAQVVDAPEDEESTSLENTAANLPARLLYQTEENGDQKLWYTDLTKQDPSLLVSGVQVLGYGGSQMGGIIYGGSQEQDGAFDFYFMDLNDESAVLISSGAYYSRAIKSPDRSSIIAISMIDGFLRVDLVNAQTGQIITLLQETERIRSFGNSPIYNDSYLSLYIDKDDHDEIHIISFNSQQGMRILDEGQRIYPLYTLGNNYLMWITVNPESSILYVFDPTNDSSRELLQAPKIEPVILEDGSVSLTLYKGDGTEQYFRLSGIELQEKSGHVVDISPDGQYQIYQKKSQKYFGATNESGLRELSTINERVDRVYFTPDSQYVIYSINSEDQSINLRFDCMSTGLGEKNGIGYYSVSNSASNLAQPTQTIQYPASLAFISTDPEVVYLLGFVLSRANPSWVISYKTFLTGDHAGTYLINQVGINDDYSSLFSTGEGALIKQPRFTPNEQAMFILARRSNGAKILELVSSEYGEIIFTSESLSPEAKDISYQYTPDGNFAVIGITTKNDEGKIYILDLNTYEIGYLTNGSSPFLLDPYSLDGIRAWE